MSGTRATFTLKEGASISKREVAEALKKKNLKLDRFRRERREQPAASYLVEATGLG